MQPTLAESCRLTEVPSSVASLHRLACAVLSLGLLALPGCSEDETSILVTVTSDLEVPIQADQLRIVIDDADVGSPIVQDYELTSAFPHSVSIRPGEMYDGEISIVASALLGGTEVVSSFVRETFVQGQQVEITIDLSVACMEVMCPPSQTCVDGLCVTPPMPDLGPRDMGPDGGPIDMGEMGPDDMQMDMPVCDPTMCDDDVACTIDTCELGACRNEPDDSLCEEGFTCDVMAGCPPRVCEADSQCGDGVICNGMEVCTDMSCAAGTPVDCDDADACTDDICDEMMREMPCRHATRDLDGDGFGDMLCAEVGGVPATDCNDDNPDVFPGSVEICNGLDDDCNGECDETSTCCRGTSEPCMTSCGTTGSRTCGASCSWSVCAPPAETCNGVDDDCNGAADDVFECIQGATEACTTSCGSAGMRTCSATCGWGACEAPGEVCNGLDDDCNGTADDTFACVAGSTTDCTTTCGSTGTITCDGTTCMPGACVPPAEGCTGADDDCDGSIDESAECTAGETTSCMTTCGSTGTRTCSSMCIFGSCTPPVEVCNGADDDCDARVDEDFTCVPGSTGSCGTSCGTSGTRTCTSSCEWGSCTPPIEACNGADDDCDTMCDEAFTCCAGTSGSCTTSCGTTGTRTCSASCGWSACSPPAEVCNGVDDDCNGACDDGVGTCCAGRTGTCTTTCGSTGSRVCNSSCGWGTCSPPMEACSGADDDCDGNIDEGFACSPGEEGTCTTSCGSMGTTTCGGSCTFGSCMAPTETCNGVDDDCDGTTDEGCGACGSCTGATTVNTPGGRYDVTLTANAETGSCGGAGSEGYLTFTTTGVRDVFITTHQALGIDTVLYVRECQCAGGTETACNDDSDGLGTSMLQLTDLPAGTYNVFVDTKTAMSGSIPVDVYITNPGAESDRCGQPTFLPAGSSNLSGNTCGFDADTAPPTDTGCSFIYTGEGPERFYYFVVPTTRTVTVNGCTAGTVYDTTVYIRDICTNTTLASSIECNDDGCGGPSQCDRALRSSLTVTLDPGLYYFVADGYDSGTTSCPCGDFDYSLSGF